MAAAIKGYKMILIMPDNSSAERKAAMTAYGAELILVTQEEGMEGARDLAERMEAEGRGLVLDQFANGDNPEAHYTTTGPEIWRQTQGTITHFVSSMGTTGTIMGVSRYLKEQTRERADHRPAADGRLGHPGIRRWPRSTCRRSTTPIAWTASSTWPKAKPKTPPVAWPAKKAFSAACLGRCRGGHAAPVQRSGKRGDRRDHLRPWRPLPVDRHFRRAQLMAKHERGLRFQPTGGSKAPQVPWAKAAPDHRAPGQ
jgi:hypothetical protein